MLGRDGIKALKYLDFYIRGVEEIIFYLFFLLIMDPLGLIGLKPSELIDSSVEIIIRYSAYRWQSKVLNVFASISFCFILVRLIHFIRMRRHSRKSASLPAIENIEG
jgi:hypothetical protein